MLHWERGTYPHKYKVTLPDGRTVSFGHQDYEQYKDRTPLKLYTAHLDLARRRNYERRHRGILTKDGRRAVDVKYSPAWFSLRYLW